MRFGCASGLYRRGADNEECWDETPLEGALEFEFELELGSEVRSTAAGLGDLEGLLCFDMMEGLLEEGKEDNEVLRLAYDPPAPPGIE